MLSFLLEIVPNRMPGDHNEFLFDVSHLQSVTQSYLSSSEGLSSNLRDRQRMLDMVNNKKEFPSLVMLLPCARNQSDWLSTTAFKGEKFVLSFICPVSLCAVQCGPTGVGWEITVPDEWVQRWGPALLVTLQTLLAAAKSGRQLGLAIPPAQPVDHDKLTGSVNYDNFVIEFLGAAGNYITSNCSNTGCAGVSYLPLGDSTIPTSQAVDLAGVEDAYSAIQSFMTQFGQIDELLEGRMRRVESREGRCEWVSAAMAEQWKFESDQFDTILLDSCRSVEPSPFPWLTDQLASTTKIASDIISNSVDLLVQQGIDCEDVLAGISEEDFTSSYLRSIGISSLGVQQHLLRIHKDIRSTLNPLDSSASGSLRLEEEKAVEILALRQELNSLKAKLNSVSGDTDSEISFEQGAAARSVLRDQAVQTSPAVLRMKPPSMKKGFVMKQGQMFKSWRNRFFVLNEGNLYYYARESSQPPYGESLKGTLQLEHMVCLEKGSILTLTSSGRGDRDFVVEIKDNEDREAWKEAFESHAEYFF